ncbi:MAG: PAS domain S-box protein [Thermodesulfobacteriota bacterium]|nr:PAS domain S-box protein [Thermodesulfobacteriota bacterium]
MGKNDEHGKYIQNAPTGLNEIDFIHQKILSVNKVVCKSTGYTEEELLQKNIGEMLTRKSVLNKFQERV